jgi:O-methyltransferase
MTETWATRVRLGLHRALACLSYGATHFRHPLRTETWSVATTVVRSIRTATTPLECAEIYQTVKACEKLPGDMAEVGVFRGGTAAIMLAASKKRLHLFDTFEGLPHGEDDLEKGEWAGSLTEVKDNLARWLDRIEWYPGLFPNSAPRDSNLSFSFVHLDLDLYSSTSAALQWFWPRMVPGAVILSHDYPTLDGVVRAFHEFFDSKAQPFFPLAGCQCMAVKL